MYHNVKSDVIYFTGASPETSPVQGKKTLYVVGTRSIPGTVALAKEHNCKHVHLGAQRSFQRNKIWDLFVRTLINEGFTVTLEYPVDAHDFVQNNMSIEMLNSNRFYPLMTIQVDHIETVNKNTALKIFGNKNTNSGVWTLPINEVLDTNRFTAVDQIEFEIVSDETEKK